MSEFAVGQRIKIKVEKIALGGDGIGHKDGFVLFVPYTCPQESAEVCIIEKRKNFARATPLQFIEKSPVRQEPPCPYYFNPSPSPSPTRGEGFRMNQSWCGGCNFQHINYATQLKQKEISFAETLSKIGGIASDKIVPLLPVPEENLWRFRNKIQIPFAKNENGEIVAGFFAPQTHEIVPIEDCLIHPQEMMGIVKLVKSCMQDWALSPYSEKLHRGWLRHLLIRQSASNHHLLVTFVTCDSSFPYKKQWIAELKMNFPKIAGIWQNVNSKKTNVILGKKWKKIWGENALVEKFPSLPLELRVSAGAFFQVNTQMAEKLYLLVRELLSEEVTERKALLDLYCGVGGIGLSCAPFFEKVVGVDENPYSISDAKANARMNHCSHCMFICSGVEEFMQSAPQSDSRLRISSVVLDPPRKGVPEKVLLQITKLQPERILYVSCDPATLARDLKILLTKNYRIQKIIPLDFFPHSAHIESVALLKKERGHEKV